LTASLQIESLKSTDSVDTITSNVLRDVPFSRYQPLQSADAKYIIISKNKIKNGMSLTKFKNPRRTYLVI